MSKTLDLLKPPLAEGVLQSVLSAAQLHAQVTDRFEACGATWEAAEPSSGNAWFHLIEDGACAIRCAALAEPLRLDAGDLVVFPSGAAHQLSAAPAQDPTSEPRAQLLCGEFRFDFALASHLFRALPPSIVVRHQADGGRLAALASVLRREADERAFGYHAVLDQLSAALFVIALREHLRTTPPSAGLLAALADSRLTSALSAIHAEPGAAWTVESLAARAAMSRSAFAQRFNATLGEPPMQYLSHWRMTLALARLRENRQSIAQIALDLGFETEAAFRRAFKRVHGVAPGAARRSTPPTEPSEPDQRRWPSRALVR
jgi:AraC family transcriptional regulator, activator of mtrCDE